jgi:hypothetical protein
MADYTNFVQNEIKYAIGDFVIVANEQRMKQQRTETARRTVTTSSAIITG